MRSTPPHSLPNDFHNGRQRKTLVATQLAIWPACAICISDAGLDEGRRPCGVHDRTDMPRGAVRIFDVASSSLPLHGLHIYRFFTFAQARQWTPSQTLRHSRMALALWRSALFWIVTGLRL
jgi:hypothetical protein